AVIDSVLQRLSRSVGRRIALHEGRISEAFRRSAVLFADASRNINCLDIATNGEGWLIQRFAASCARAPMILDVGGNVGEWALRMASAVPTATIHVFEPSPMCSEQLANQVEANNLKGRVTLNPFALADREATIELYEYEDTSLCNTFGWH